MTNLIITLDFYYKNIFMSYKFDNCYKYFNIIKFFSLFISISYLLYHVIQDLPKPIFFQFKILFFYNNINFT